MITKLKKCKVAIGIVFLAITVFWPEGQYTSFWEFWCFPWDNHTKEIATTTAIALSITGVVSILLLVPVIISKWKEIWSWIWYVPMWEPDE